MATEKESVTSRLSPCTRTADRLFFAKASALNILLFYILCVLQSLTWAFVF